jgi:hypothetical protein
MDVLRNVPFEVATMRDASGQVCADVTPARVTGSDGKSYPARRPTIVAAKNERGLRSM